MSILTVRSVRYFCPLSRFFLHARGCEASDAIRHEDVQTICLFGPGASGNIHLSGHFQSHLVVKVGSAILGHSDSFFHSRPMLHAKPNHTTKHKRTLHTKCNISLNVVLSTQNFPVAFPEILYIEKKFSSVGEGLRRGLTILRI